MRSTQQMSITLPLEIAAAVKNVESWLHAQVLPAYDALKADPSRGVTADQVRARLGLDSGGITLEQQEITSALQT
ncbi:MAG: hypothetical protein AABY68_13010 [Pseudomonadota bacterium]